MFENEHFFSIAVMLEFPLASHWWAALGIYIYVTCIDFIYTYITFV